MQSAYTCLFNELTFIRIRHRITEAFSNVCFHTTSPLCIYAILPLSRTKLLLHLYLPGTNLETSLTLPSHSTLPDISSFEFYFKVVVSLSLSSTMPYHTHLIKHTHIPPMHTLLQACYLIFILCILQSPHTVTTFTLSHKSNFLLPTLPTTTTQFKICTHFKTH
jgi:hypothetical protein